MMKFLFFFLGVSLANSLYISDEFDKSFKDKIVGGREIDIKLAPYLAQIIQNGIQVCGGSIITETWILTAAHCFDNFKGKKILVTTGSSYQGAGQKHAIAALHVHRYYNNGTVDNDIALVKLRRPMIFDKTQKSINISTTLPVTGDKMRISGFGRIGERLGFSDNLKSAIVAVIDRDECQSKYEGDDIKITENMFCAAKKGTDSCEGDSGGPAVINGKLSGIISFGIGCASSEYPGVYTQIHRYHKWIATKTGLTL